MNKIYVTIILCLISACTKVSAEQKCHKWNKFTATCTDCTNNGMEYCKSFITYPCVQTTCEY